VVKHFYKIPGGLQWLSLWLLAVAAASGQQGFGPGTTTVPPLTGAPSLAPLAPAAPPASTLQAPTFDPYSTQPNSSFGAPLPLSTPPPLSGSFGAPAPAYSQPYSLPSPGAQPYSTQPNLGFGTQSPPALFPYGLQGPTQPASGFASANPLKFLQNLRFSDDHLCGDSGKSGDMRINDAFATTTLAFPNFLWTGQPWFLSPGFGYHSWSGPFGTWADENGTDQFYPMLPPDAYSAFLDIGWRSSPDRAFGAELGGRIGLYSDFSGIDDQSFRPMGLALLRYNLTPTMALKAGVSYINRADIKLLPAGGIVWTPSPKTKWDIFFPQPKLASYLTTLGNQDLWWYVAGEYGGGVWTVNVSAPNLATPNPNDYLPLERTLMDINDLRVSIGIELGPQANSSVGQRGLFFEVGYVFNREMVLVVPVQQYSLNDTWMLRGGFAF
jgi:hypothetical protein